MPKPIEITLYNPETNEPIQTFVRSFVPWAVLKQALAMQQTLQGGDLTGEDLDALAGLVVTVFGDKFSVEQATQGADAGEMIAVIKAVVSRASQFVSGNPTTPAGS